jgi:hypothetical protein
MRKLPESSLFDQTPKIDKPRLCIQFCNFEDMTLASLVHWTSLTYREHLAIKNIDGFERWQRDGFDPAQHKHDIFNWTFMDVNEAIASSEQSMANVLYSLQLMAVEQSLKNHADTWNLAGAVFEWLKDYTTDETELQRC